MATRKVYSHEILRILAQWLGLGMAAIPCGLLLGILMRYGVEEKTALAVSLPVGFVLAASSWVLVGRCIVVKPIEYTSGVCTDVVSLPEYGAVAIAVLCVTLYSFQPLSGASNHSTAASSINALSQL
jgi:hypothetical protein